MTVPAIFRRLALRDPSIEPPYRGDFGFADQYTYRNPRTGRMTKKRHLEAPGAGDDIIGFLDYHSQGETSDGKPFLYIDYMKTRREHKGQGVATKLLDEFISASHPSLVQLFTSAKYKTQICGASTRKLKRNTQSTRLWEQRTSDEKTINRVAKVFEGRGKP